jgi:hypothetical protein
MFLLPSYVFSKSYSENCIHLRQYSLDVVISPRCSTDKILADIKGVFTGDTAREWAKSPHLRGSHSKMVKILYTHDASRNSK